MNTQGYTETRRVHSQIQIYFPLLFFFLFCFVHAAIFRSVWEMSIKISSPLFPEHANKNHDIKKKEIRFARTEKGQFPWIYVHIIFQLEEIEHLQVSLHYVDFLKGRQKRPVMLCTLHLKLRLKHWAKLQCGSTLMCYAL